MEIQNILNRKIKSELFFFRNENEKWLAFIGEINNEPVLICTCKNEEWLVSPKYKTSYIFTTMDNTGNLVYDVEIVDLNDKILELKDITKNTKQEYRNYEIFISSLLQNGVSIKKVLEVIRLCGFNNLNINTWESAVHRLIKKLMPVDESYYERKCVDCGGSNLKIIDGCIMCTDCGYAISY